MSLFLLPTFPQMKCVVGAPAASVVSAEIVFDLFLWDHSYISWISQFSRMCQEYVYLFQGLPQSGVMLEGYIRQQIAESHYLMEWKSELLKKTPNRHVTFRTRNPGQQFDAGIKYVWSSRNSDKNMSLLWRFLSQLDVWFWTPCAPCAWSLHSQAVSSSLSSLLRLCLSNIAPLSWMT